jgi:hypothetical protein
VTHERGNAIFDLMLPKFLKGLRINKNMKTKITLRNQHLGLLGISIDQEKEQNLGISTKPLEKFQ